MTKVQRQALDRVNAAAPMVTQVEYAAMSPFHQEKVRQGFDADGAPVIKIQGVHVKYHTAQYLVANGYAVSTYTHRRDYAYLIPKS